MYFDFKNNLGFISSLVRTEEQNNATSTGSNEIIGRFIERWELSCYPYDEIRHFPKYAARE